MTKLRQLWLLTALGSLAALALGYFLLVSPKANEAAALREETESQLTMNRQLQAKIDQLNKQKIDLPKMQAALDDFETLVPANPAQPALIRMLSDAADKAGVDLESMTPTVPAFSKGMDLTTRQANALPVTAPKGMVLVNIPVVIKVNGLYPNISQFFDELEALPRAMLVPGFTLGQNKGVQFLPKGVSKDENVLTAEINSVVFMTAKSAAPPVAAPVAPPADVTK